jgi:cytochrome P450
MIEDERRLLSIEDQIEGKKSSDQSLLRLLGKCQRVCNDVAHLSIVRSSLSEQGAASQMSDDELLNQLSTFVFGATDTVATSISWMLHLLSIHQDWQTRLREEVTPIVNGEPAQIGERLDTSILLDHIIRESLRVGSPVHATIRMSPRLIQSSEFLNISRCCHER